MKKGLSIVFSIIFVLLIGGCVGKESTSKKSVSNLKLTATSKLNSVAGNYTWLLSFKALDSAGNDLTGAQVDIYDSGIKIASTTESSVTITLTGEGKHFIMAKIGDFSSEYIILEITKSNLNSPSFEITTGTNKNEQIITIKCDTTAAAIYYTLDGTEPNEKTALLYTGPIKVTKSTLIKAFAYIDVNTKSTSIFSKIEITEKPTKPLLSINSSDYIELQNPVSGVVVKVTTDGSEPSASNGIIYTSPIKISDDTIIKAKAFINGTSSDLFQQLFSVTIPAPKFDVAYTNQEQLVTITVNKKQGDVIRYTLDGSEPNENSPIYDGNPINLPLNSTVVIHAKLFTQNSSSINNSTIEYKSDYVPNPIFSIKSGLYKSQQILELSSPLTGTAIRYTTDGKDPDKNSPLYSTGIVLKTNNTYAVKAKAFKEGYKDSNIVAEVYIITGKLEKPSMTPYGGVYDKNILISLLSSEDSATIRYTTDGKDPTDTSNIFENGITLPINIGVMVKARVYKENWEPSDIVANNYFINSYTDKGKLTFSNNGGIFAGPTSLKIDYNNVEGKLVYTLDGTDPNKGGSIYTDFITITKDTKLNIRMMFNDGSFGELYTLNYMIRNVTDILSVSPKGGIYTTGQSINISSQMQGKIVYTLDGTDPNATLGTEYKGPFSIGKSATLKVRLILDNGTMTEIMSENYTITGKLTGNVTPNILPGKYTTQQGIIFSGIPEGATLIYTTNGSEPSTTTAIIYKGDSIAIKATTIIKAILLKDNWESSALLSFAYVIEIDKVRKPIFDLKSGTYTTTQSLTISTTQSGVKFYYTLDGKIPDDKTGTLYKDPIKIDRTMTVKAIGVLSGYNSSEIASADYEITGKVSQPIFNIKDGKYSAPISVELKSITTGATIRYTTDNSIPDEKSPVYTSAIKVPMGTTITIKARAFMDKWAPSEIVTANYTVEDPFYIINLSVLNGVVLMEGDKVSINGATDAAIYYTLDETTPLASSNPYNNLTGIVPEKSGTLTAVVIKNGEIRSNIAKVQFLVKSSIPTITPSSGKYDLGKLISFASSGKIYYTTDGSIPTINSVSYLNPFYLNGDMNIKVVSIKNGCLSSDVVEAKYTVNPPPIAKTPAPQFSIPDGVVSEGTQLLITATNASIYYTLDNSTPTASSIKYTGALTLDKSITIKSAALQTGKDISDVITASYLVKTKSPVISPAEGTIMTGTQIIINGTGKIYYTIDGSEPTTSSAVYTKPIVLEKNGMVKAKSEKDGCIISDTIKASYTLTNVELQKSDVPKFSVASGTVIWGTMLTITATPGAIIYYTTDGTNPDRTSKIYDSFIFLNKGMIVSACSEERGKLISEVISANYAVRNFKPVLNPASSYLTQKTTVTLTGNGTIYYTIDGSVPTTSSSVYTQGILVYKDVTIKAVAVKEGCLVSETLSETYTVNIEPPPRAAIPTFSVAQGIVADGTILKINSSSGTKIYYTTDGTMPTKSSTLYGDGILLDKNMTILAIATADNVTDSDIATASYIVKSTPPTINPVAKTVSAGTMIYINGDGTIYYTKDGTIPTTASSIYTNSFAIASSTTVKAINIKSGCISSDIAEAGYYIAGTVPMEKAAAPIFDINSGVYNSVQTLKITSSQSGAKIIYTIDGTLPDETNGLIYKEPITIDKNITIKAIAIVSGYKASDVVTADYQIIIPVKADKPKLSIAGSIVDDGTILTITTTTSATIYYTIDGTIPNASSPKYTGSIVLNKSITINACSFETGKLLSDAATESYKVRTAAPIVSPLSGIVTSGTSVTITATGTIYYTLDNTNPNTTSSVYTTGFVLDKSTTIKAIAIKEGCIASNMTEESYTIKPLTKITPIVDTTIAATTINVGIALSSSMISGTFKVSTTDSTPVAGLLTWSLPSTIVTVSGLFEWTFTPNDLSKYTTVTGTVNVTANKITPIVDMTIAATSVKVGTALSASTLSGTFKASATDSTPVIGLLIWAAPTTIVTTSSSFGWIFVPNDSLKYNTVAGIVSLIADKITPVVDTAIAGTSVNIGTTLSSSILSGSFKVSETDLTPVPGTLNWNNSSTVVSTSASFVWTFTPTDSLKYTSVTGMVTVTANKITPVVDTSIAATSINIGTPISASTLSGTFKVSATDTTPISGLLTWAAPTTIVTTSSSFGWIFTPDDSLKYNTVIGTVTLIANKITPIVDTTIAATPINIGMALSASTLSGTFKVSASDSTPVTGTLNWTNSSTIVNTTGSFSWIFTPNDTFKYTTVSGVVSVTASKITPVVDTAISATSVYAGQSLANSVITGTFKESSSNTTAVAGVLAWSNSSTIVNTTGTFEWIFTPTNTALYNIVTGTVTVTGTSYTIIATAAIAGVAAPATGQTPTSSITSTAEYTATISWSPTSTPFEAVTVYTATITLTPKAGYTLNGVGTNFFTVAGATATNSANSGVVTAVFPSTRDITPPTASILYYLAADTGYTTPLTRPFNQGTSLVIRATFSEAIADSPVMQTAMSGVATVAAVNMTKEDATHYKYAYTVPTGNGTQTVTLSTGTDLATNVVTATPTSGATFTVDNTPPTIVSATLVD